MTHTSFLQYYLEGKLQVLFYAWQCLDVGFGWVSVSENQGTLKEHLVSTAPSVTMVHFLLKQCEKLFFL